LIARLDNWALQIEGSVVETSVVWYDGTPVAVYIPHRPFFLIKWFKDYWACHAVEREVARWVAEGEAVVAIEKGRPGSVTYAQIEQLETDRLLLEALKGGKS
jgi:hypothetical protein